MNSASGAASGQGPRFFHVAAAAALLAQFAVVAVTLHTTIPLGREVAARSAAVVVPVTQFDLSAIEPPALRLLPATTDRLEAGLDRLGIDLDLVRDGAARVPRVRVVRLPEDIAQVSNIERRKSLFLRTALPLILMANEEVHQERIRLRGLRARAQAGLPVGEVDRRWLSAMAARYRVSPGDPAALLERVDTVPAGLALAQSIEESGWGTSRFSREGRALFGQRTWSPETSGLVPVQRVTGESFRVRSFSSLMQSVRAYLHNLNLHPAYAELRAERARQRANEEPLAGDHLAGFLIGYSELGEAYVEKIRGLIRSNRLAAFDRARLVPKAGAQIATIR